MIHEEAAKKIKTKQATVAKDTHNNQVLFTEMLHYDYPDDC